MLKQFYLTFCIGVFAISSNAQTADQFLKSQKATEFQKLYLHTDREFYFYNDTLWFSAYLVDAENHIFYLDTCNLYVELFNKQGELMQKEMFLLSNGFSSGYLGLNNKILAEGNYLVRAYTDRIKELGTDYSFSKKIKISAVKSNLNRSGNNDVEIKKVSLEFFPEGGFLLDGKINQLVFKAFDEENNPINVQGKLRIVSSQQSFDFISEYKGMGSIYFIPDADEKYKIELENYKVVNTSLPEIKERGTKLMPSKINENDVSLIILSNEDPQDYYIAFLHRGEGNNYIKINAASNDKTIKILNKNLRPGINRMILLNANFEPVSERLLFINDPESIVDLKITSSKQSYKTREEINLEIESFNELDKNHVARLSLSVVNNDVVSKGVSQTIQSYLLLGSELKGFVGNSADYFLDSDGVKSRRKLDLLMLSNGWSNYVWNDRIGKEYNTTPSIVGMNIHGHVTKFSSSKPLIGTEVMLSLRNEVGGSLELTQTNEKGDYSFRNISFYDTTLLIVQAYNYRAKSYTSLQVNYSGKESALLNANELNDFNESIIAPIALYRQKYLNEQKLDEFYPDRNSRILEEIEVIGKKEELDDGHFRIYGNPDHSVEIEQIHTTFRDIFEFLTGRFPGVQVVGDNVTIRGYGSLSGGSDPLYLIDGIPTDKEAAALISMFDVDKIEVLKGANAAIYGVRGANGVISVFTRRGGDFEPLAKPIPGTFIKRIKGFQAHREFFTPRYTSDNINSEIPDYRTTLYWNPNLILGNNKASVSFFSCDNLSRYKVIVEGITADGKICLGEASFDVDERR